MLMEFLEGQTLGSLLEQEGRLVPERAALILYQICDSLNEAHEAQVIHRDIKPENLIIQELGTGEEQVKVLDFGVARLRAEGACLTAPGMLFGTAAYASPEQVRGESELDGRSDLYALGILLYEMLSGHNPFYPERQGSVREVLMRQLGPRPALPLGPPQLARICLSLLALDKSERPKSARTLQQQLLQAGFASTRNITPTFLIEEREQLKEEREFLKHERAALQRQRLGLEQERLEFERRLSSDPQRTLLSAYESRDGLRGPNDDGLLQLPQAGFMAVVSGGSQPQGHRAAQELLALLGRFLRDTERAEAQGPHWEGSRFITALRLARLQLQEQRLEGAFLYLARRSLQLLRAGRACIMRLRGEELKELGYTTPTLSASEGPQRRIPEENYQRGDLFLLSPTAWLKTLSTAQIQATLNASTDLEACCGALLDLQRSSVESRSLLLVQF